MPDWLWLGLPDELRVPDILLVADPLLLCVELGVPDAEGDELALREDVPVLDRVPDLLRVCVCVLERVEDELCVLVSVPGAMGRDRSKLRNCKSSSHVRAERTTYLLLSPKPCLSGFASAFALESSSPNVCRSAFVSDSANASLSTMPWLSLTAFAK